MSIITDALRKAEQDREFKTKQAAADSALTVLLEEPITVPDYARQMAELVEEEITEKKAVTDHDATFKLRSILRILGIAVALFISVLSLIAVVFFIYNLVINLITLKPSRNTSLTIPINMQPLIKPLPHSGQNSQSGFALSGVTHVGDDFYAIINGTIVQKGDTIAGAKVKEIFERDVVLETRSGEVKLKINT